MKKKITEKQLQFLSDFLDKKGYGNDETKFELMDHLVCEFEEKGNGNLSEFLSHKLSFIRDYKTKHKNIIFRVYKKEVISEFKTYFLNFNKIPITILSFLTIYLIVTSFNQEFVLIATMISIVSVLFYTYFLILSTKKSIRKTTAMTALSSIILVPSILIYLPKDFYSFLLSYDIFYSFFWFLAFLINLSSASYIKRKKEFILNKYQHLID